MHTHVCLCVYVIKNNEKQKSGHEFQRKQLEAYGSTWRNERKEDMM